MTALAEIRRGSGRNSFRQLGTFTKLKTQRDIRTDKPFFRTVQFDRSAVDDTARTVRLSISSDEPYLRRDFFGEPYYEVLDHSLAGVVTDRLKAGTALLFNHATSQHLGRNISFENDGHKCTVVSKFSRSAFAEEKWQDVIDQILVDASVGYQVLDAEELDQEIEGIPVYKIKWEVLEHSLVTVPADFSVGVGRSNTQAFINQRQQHMKTETPEITDINQPQENNRTAEQEKERIREIHAIGKRADVPANEIEKAIENNISSNAFRKHAFENYFGKPWPQVLDFPSGYGNGDLRSGNGNNNRSIAAQIVGHSEARRMLEGGKKSISFVIEGVRTFREALIRAGIVTTGDAGTTVQQVPSVQGVAYEVLTVADLLADGTMNSGKIAYPREVSFTPAATTVQETGVKPGQDFDLEPAEAAAKKIAAFTKISDELLQDSPAAAAYINNRLGFAVLKAEDLQILRGDGLGSNMKGIHSTQDLQAQAKGADIAPDAIRKAINSVETNTDFYCTGIVLHPTDFMNIELLKDLQGRYLVQPILIRGELGQMLLAPSLWGKPIAISKSETQGTALVGAFKTAAQLFRRTGLMIEMTNSNEDDFRRNLIAIRAELRAALAVYSGAAFCEVTGL